MGDYDLKRGTQFLSRIGAIPRHRQPQPALEVTALKVHSLTLRPPLPLPDLVAAWDGEPPPDRPQTEEWPPTIS